MTAGNPGLPFVVVLDRERIFSRGAEFQRQDTAMTCWTASWPDGLVLRDTADDWRYVVREFRTPRSTPHQRLESLCGTRTLVPVGNGNLREVTLDREC